MTDGTINVPGLDARGATAMKMAMLYGWNAGWKLAMQQLESIPAEKMTVQPHGLKNHPAWTLAHILHYHPAILALLRGQGVEDPRHSAGADKYGAGSQPVDDPKLYPAKNELIARFRDNHQKIVAAVEQADPAVFSQPPGLPRWQPEFWTAGSAATYLMLVHERHHLAEIVAWKHVMGI